MAEWSKVPVLKTGVGTTNRRFESCFFRISIEKAGNTLYNKRKGTKSYTLRNKWFCD
jgi:hypothetical protein